MLINVSSGLGCISIFFCTDFLNMLPCFEERKPLKFAITLFSVSPKPKGKALNYNNIANLSDCFIFSSHWVEVSLKNMRLIMFQGACCWYSALTKIA